MAQMHISPVFFIYAFLAAVFFMVNFRQGMRINVFLFINSAHILVFAITPLVFGMYDMLGDHYFQFLILLSYLGLIAAQLVPIPVKARANKLELIPYRATILFYISLAIYAFSLLQSLMSFDISQNRMMESLEQTHEGSSLNSFLIRFVHMGGLISLVYLWKKQSYGVSLLYIGLLTTSMVITAAHRTTMFMAIMLPVFFYFLYYRQGRVRLASIIALTAITLSIFFFGSYYRAGVLGSADFKGVTLERITKHSLKGLSTSKYFYKLYKEEYPKEWMQNSHYYFISMVPRRLWQEKPIVSFNVRTTEKLFDVNIGESSNAYVRTYTLPGEGYVQLGALGVLLFSFLGILVFRLWIWIYNFFEHAELLAVTPLLSIFILMRSAFDSIWNSFLGNALFLLFIVLALYRFKYKKCDNSFFRSLHKTGFYFAYPTYVEENEKHNENSLDRPK